MPLARTLETGAETKRLKSSQVLSNDDTSGTRSPAAYEDPDDDNLNPVPNPFTDVSLLIQHYSHSSPTLQTVISVPVSASLNRLKALVRGAMCYKGIQAGNDLGTEILVQQEGHVKKLTVYWESRGRNLARYSFPGWTMITENNVRAVLLYLRQIGVSHLVDVTLDENEE